jgi:cytochrome c peroxidase
MNGKHWEQGRLKQGCCGARAGKGCRFRHTKAMGPRLLNILLGGLLIAVAAPAFAAPQKGMSRAIVYRQVDLLGAIGRNLFFDPALSASGKLSCSSCHDPSHAYGPPNALAVEPGGKDMQQMGLRAVPSLRYMQATPQFSEHYYDSDDEGDASVDNGPTGGLTWDGRVDRGREQARLPLLSPFEMANDSPASVVARVRSSAFAGKLRQVSGAAVFADTGRAFEAILQAFETFEQNYVEFNPFSSKYDDYLAGKVKLTAQEARGLAVFNDPTKGNCAHCHFSSPDKDGTPPLFTDHGLVALGVPRNKQIPANADPAYYDLGLCGPLRTDLRAHPEYCGMFKSPTLRNVATRQTFFHNGIFHTLKEVLKFYAERDTNPERWYPRNQAGSVRKFDDLPPAYRANVNVEPPFDRHVGEKPALSDEEIDDMIAFLQTLNDGYRREKQ